VVCLLGACGDEAPPLGVQHLDPRLADGRSSAPALALPQPVWQVELLTPDPTHTLGEWRLRFAERAPSPAGFGTYFIGNVAEDTRFKRVELVYAGELDAEDVDVVELELARTTRGLARVEWRGDALPADAATSYADAIVPGSHEPDRVRIALGDHPDWRGTIRELVLVPKVDGRQRFDLVAVRIGRIGFTPGPDSNGRDGGLIARGRQARRTWPTDWGVPLFASAFVPKGGSLCVDTTLAARFRALDEPVHFAVDVDAGRGWVNAAARTFVPARSAAEELDHGEHGWVPLRADLSRWAGKQVELRLRAWRGAGDPRDAAAGTEGRLERAAAYFGAPLVIEKEPAGTACRPNLVLLTLDTTRADALGEGPDGRSVTPFLDSLAADGLVCADAWTACNATTPSHASILTGIAVQDHGVMDNRSLLGAESTTLAELLREAGWETAAAVSVEHLQSGKSGLGQGFDRFLLAGTDSSLDGALTIAGVEAWLAEWRAGGARPLFLWVHLFDPHTPYGPPQAFLSEYASKFQLACPEKTAEPASLPETRWHADFLAGVTNREWPEFMYRAEVAYTDVLAQRLEQSLERHLPARPAAWFVLADHGEALGEHDNYYHHTGLYAEVMQIPLLARGPGIPRARIDVPTWSLDVAPTILTYAGLPVPAEVRGRDLVALARESAPAPRRLWFEHSDLHQAGCADGELTFIATLVDYEQWGRERRLPAGTREVYRRREDPGQTHNVDEARDELEAALAAWRASALERSSARGALSPEDEAELNKIGY
jgi:arylsulfatase A-like enzyme